MSRIEEIFTQLSELEQAQSFPPVQDWHPEREGDIDIHIDTSGDWYHEGERFERKSLVKLFASILRKDDDGYCLVTPAEKLRIQVDDVPFLATDVEQGQGRQGPELIFTTNVDEYVTADAEHPIWVESPDDSPRPYVHVRSGLNALISRPLFYRLAEMAEEEGGRLWLTSRGARFPLN